MPGIIDLTNVVVELSGGGFDNRVSLVDELVDELRVKLTNISLSISTIKKLIEPVLSGQPELNETKHVPSARSPHAQKLEGLISYALQIDDEIKSLISQIEI